MQSAVTNGAASRAHRFLDAAISAGLAPEGNLTIAERGKGRRNRPYKCGSTVAPFVTAIYNSMKQAASKANAPRRQAKRRAQSKPGQCRHQRGRTRLWRKHARHHHGVIDKIEGDRAT